MKRILCLALALILCLVSGALSEIVLPTELKVIETEAFAGDASITSVIIPEGVTTLQARAFAGSGLLSVCLPASLENIDEDAFDDCPQGLTAYGPAGTKAAKFCQDHGILYQTPDQRKVGVSMPTSAFQRWTNDGECIRDALESALCTVDLRYADNHVETQQDQIASMISGGCKALVIAPVSDSSLTGALALAKSSGIPVIAFDRLLTNSDAVTCYVTFDNYQVGVVQAQYIIDALSLDSAAGPFAMELTTGDPGDGNAALFFQGAIDTLRPYLQAGKLVVRSGQTSFEACAARGWSSQNAKNRADSILSAWYGNGDIDAWLCSNDSTALGVIDALEDYIHGQWPVITGQDCDLQNVRLILDGKQSMSIFKDTGMLAQKTAEIALRLLDGAQIDTNGSFDNGAISVPASLVKPIYADQSNYRRLLIDSGLYPEEYLFPQ